MNQTAIETRPAETIDADVSYAIDTGEKLINQVHGPNSRLRTRIGGERDVRSVTIQNARGLAENFAIDKEGFVLAAHPTKVADFWDVEELKSVYYPEVQALIKAYTGASAVHVFDHTLRSGDEKRQEENFARLPVTGVHNDYTEWSGPQRVRDFLPADEAEALLEHPFAIIQVWRAIGKTIERDPLAICSSEGIEDKDFIAVERRSPERIGQTYSVMFNPNHRWFYVPKMQRDEALVFKVYDSRKDGRSRWSAHTSIQDPTSPPNAPPRESIEIRTIVSFAP